MGFTDTLTAARKVISMIVEVESSAENQAVLLAKYLESRDAAVRKAVFQEVHDAQQDTVDIDGFFDEKNGVHYIGKAARTKDGSYRALANVGGSLCLVECSIRWDENRRPNPERHNVNGCFHFDVGRNEVGLRCYYCTKEFQIGQSVYKFDKSVVDENTKRTVGVTHTAHVGCGPR